VAEIAHSFDDSAAYERFMGRWSRAASAVFLDWMAAPARARWLDVGCGTGILTELILDSCAPLAVCAVDAAAAQIDHARRQPLAKRADFRVADAQALPFPDAGFDVVASALALNFIPDRPRAVAEMRRVGREGGVVAGFVWDFAEEASPSWPMRRGLRQAGIAVPDIPGTADSSRAALEALFERAGYEGIVTTSITVTVPFPDFDDFWRAQTPSYNPITKMIEGMSAADRGKLMAAVRAELPASEGGKIAYSARANAIRASVPG
jgi:ubiquinone/menaquinone biosynthesis C-methylase UbiE